MNPSSVPTTKRQTPKSSANMPLEIVQQASTSKATDAKSSDKLKQHSPLSTGKSLDPTRAALPPNTDTQPPRQLSALELQKLRLFKIPANSFQRSQKPASTKCLSTDQSSKMQSNGQATVKQSNGNATVNQSNGQSSFKQGQAATKRPASSTDHDGHSKSKKPKSNDTVTNMDKSSVTKSEVIEPKSSLKNNSNNDQIDHSPKPNSDGWFFYSLLPEMYGHFEKYVDSKKIEFKELNYYDASYWLHELNYGYGPLWTLDDIEKARENDPNFKCQNETEDVDYKTLSREDQPKKSDDVDFTSDNEDIYSEDEDFVFESDNRSNLSRHIKKELIPKFQKTDDGQEYYETSDDEDSDTEDIDMEKSLRSKLPGIELRALQSVDLPDLPEFKNVKMLIDPITEWDLSCFNYIDWVIETFVIKLVKTINNLPISTSRLDVISSLKIKSMKVYNEVVSLVTRFCRVQLAMETFKQLIETSLSNQWDCNEKMYQAMNSLLKLDGQATLVFVNPYNKTSSSVVEHKESALEKPEIMTSFGEFEDGFNVLNAKYSKIFDSVKTNESKIANEKQMKQIIKKNEKILFKDYIEDDDVHEQLNNEVLQEITELEKTIVTNLKRSFEFNDSHDVKLQVPPCLRTSNEDLLFVTDFVMSNLKSSFDLPKVTAEEKKLIDFKYYLSNNEIEEFEGQLESEAQERADIFKSTITHHKYRHRQYFLTKLISLGNDFLKKGKSHLEELWRLLEPKPLGTKASIMNRLDRCQCLVANAKKMIHIANTKYETSKTSLIDGLKKINVKQPDIDKLIELTCKIPQCSKMDDRLELNEMTDKIIKSFEIKFKIVKNVKISKTIDEKSVKIIVKTLRDAIINALDIVSENEEFIKRQEKIIETLKKGLPEIEIDEEDEPDEEPEEFLTSPTNDLDEKVKTNSKSKVKTPFEKRLAGVTKKELMMQNDVMTEMLMELKKMNRIDVECEVKQMVFKKIQEEFKKQLEQGTESMDEPVSPKSTNEIKPLINTTKTSKTGNSKEIKPVSPKSTKTSKTSKSNSKEIKSSLIKTEPVSPKSSKTGNSKKIKTLITDDTKQQPKTKNTYTPNILVTHVVKSEPDLNQTNSLNTFEPTYSPNTVLQNAHFISQLDVDPTDANTAVFIDLFTNGKSLK